MSDIAANGPMPSSRPAMTLTTAWLARVMSGNRPDLAMIRPTAIGSRSRLVSVAGSGGAGTAPLVVDGTVDMRGPPLRVGFGRPASADRGTGARRVGARESWPRVRSGARRQPGELVAQRVVGGPLGEEDVKSPHVAADRVARARQRRARGEDQ